MIIDNYLSEFIQREMVEEAKRKRDAREPSGKLSASWLYQPTLFQLYKVIGVPQKETDPYVLGKFARGSSVELWLIGMMAKANILVEQQKQVSYRDVIGYVDAMVDSSASHFKAGVIPHEIKSVTNAKMKRIDQSGVDYHYHLQACFYAIATNASHYAIDIVSGEDLRVKTFIFDRKAYAQEVEKIIDEFNEALEAWKKNRALPEFVIRPEVSWMANPSYWNFDEFWVTASHEEKMRRMEQLGLLK